MGSDGSAAPITEPSGYTRRSGSRWAARCSRLVAMRDATAFTGPRGMRATSGQRPGSIAAECFQGWMVVIAAPPAPGGARV